MNTENYTVVIHPLSEEDGGGFAAFVPDLPGCMGDGETKEAALADAHEAITAWIEAATELSRKVPEPGSAFERASERRKAMQEAMRALLDYADHAEGQIDRMEQQLDTLIKIMRDDAPYRFEFDFVAASKTGRLDHCH